MVMFSVHGELWLERLPLVGNLVFKQGSNTRMTTATTYDLLNRVDEITSTPSAAAGLFDRYYYNNASQRWQNLRVRDSASQYLQYEYDTLGQVTSGKRYANGVPLAGQQFEYAFDTIGNRKQARSGGDTNGANLRPSDYTVNLLNQYASRTVPGYVNVLGEATNAATVTVNKQATTRQGSYYRAELTVTNTSVPLWVGLTNVAVLNQGTNADLIATNMGHVLVPLTPESFTHDADGNLTSDSLWTNTWNAENRRTNIESRASVPTAGKIREQWTYLPDGRWVERIVSTNNGSTYVAMQTNRYVWDGNVLLAVLNHTNGLELAFMRGLDLSGSLQGAGGVGGLLAVHDTSTINNQPSTHFACFDGNGNVMALVNAADGKESARYEYGPFGEPLRITGVMGEVNPIRFSTQYADDFTGDLKYLYRDLRDGRWPNRDPIGERGGAQPYAFVANNSVGHFDVLGLVKFLFKQILGDPNSLYSIAGNMDELTQPQGYGESMFVNNEWSATSAITVNYFRPGKWCCNSIYSKVNQSNGNPHQDSTALILYMTDADPGTYTISLRGSVSASAERGALLADPAVGVKIYNRAAPGDQRIIEETAWIDKPVSETRPFTAIVTIRSKADVVYVADYIPTVKIAYCGKIAAIGTIEVLGYVDPTGKSITTSVPNPYE
jgi:RHS repeat-associated protein